MTTQIKLSKKQSEVIAAIRKGVKFYHNTVTNYRPYTVGNYGLNAKGIHGKIMEKLVELELIEENRLHLGIKYYTLTELGKTIQL